MHCSYVVYASAEDAQDCDHRPLLRVIVYILGIDSRQNRRWMELAIDVYTGDSLWVDLSSLPPAPTPLSRSEARSVILVLSRLTVGVPASAGTAGESRVAHLINRHGAVRDSRLRSPVVRMHPLRVSSRSGIVVITLTGIA